MEHASCATSKFSRPGLLVEEVDAFGFGDDSSACPAAVKHHAIIDCEYFADTWEHVL